MRRTETTLILLAILTAGALGQESDHEAVLLAGTGRLEPFHQNYLRSIIKGFGNPDPDLRRQAVIDVSRAGSAATPLVVETLESTTNPLIVRSSLLGLGEIGGAAAVTSIRRYYGSGDLREDERAVAVLLLGLFEPGGQSEQLREEAASRRPSLPRRAAVLALGRLADASGLRPLYRGLPREPLEDRRVALLIAAGVCRDRESLPLLVPSLKDRTAGGRRAAAFAIGEIADAAALPELLTACRREKDESVLAALALALGTFEDPASQQLLAELARAREPGVRIAALSALAARADGAAFVAEALRSARDVEVLERTALAAAAAPGTELRQPLEDLLGSNRPRVRAAAGLALAALESRESRQVILAWLAGEKNPAAHLDAVLVVGALEFEDATKYLDDGPADPGRDFLCGQVLRTFDGRRDPRLLRDRLEERLRAERARLLDRRDALLEDLVLQALDLDDITRRNAVSGETGDGGSGESGSGGEGGESEGDPGGGGGGSEVLPAKRVLRVDRRDSSVERDLETWLRDRPYFPPASVRHGCR